MKRFTILLVFAASVLLLAEVLRTHGSRTYRMALMLPQPERIPDKYYIWRDDLDGFRLVVYPLKRAKEGNVGDLYFSRDFSGRIPAQIQWSPDSKFIALTTTSSGGHSPWHYTTYVFSVADRRIVCADDTIGSVVSPEFTFKAPHTVVLGVGKSSSEGIDFEHPIKTDIDLSGLFSGKK
jgi:hypothetical protein